MTSCGRGDASKRTDLAVRHSFGRYRAMLTGLAVAAALGATPVVGAFWQLPDEPSPEGGTSQVVAQRVVDIGNGDLRWLVTEQTAQPPANATSVISGLGFIVVDSGVMLVEDRTTGEQQRLAAGEAMISLSGDDQLRFALGSEAASYHEIMLIDAASEGQSGDAVVFLSEPFDGLGARHDLDLVQDTLGPGAASAVPAGSLPTLIVILGGSADVALESGDVISLGAGETASLSGTLTVTAGENGALLAATYAGPAVPRVAQVAGTPRAGRAVESESRAQDAVEASPTPRVVAELESDESLDEDGDGLTAAQEAEAGTDPALIDTDEDGLTDGQEVLEFGTDPLVADTDGDGILDGDEVAQGSDPLDGLAEPVDEAPAEPAEELAPAVEEPSVEEPVTLGDSDGDGLEDTIEFELGTDPYDPDTDDDGLTDGDEYYVYQTGTRNPDTDGDGVLDGTEAANGTDPNDPNSF